MAIEKSRTKELPYKRINWLADSDMLQHSMPNSRVIGFGLNLLQNANTTFDSLLLPPT